MFCKSPVGVGDFRHHSWGSIVIPRNYQRSTQFLASRASLIYATGTPRLSTRQSFPVRAFRISWRTTAQLQLSKPTTTLLRCECVTNGPGRCGGAAAGVLVPLASLDPLRHGRLGDSWVGLIEDGGVLELCEVVSRVEVDLPETTSILVGGLFESDGELKLAFDRRRSCLRNGIVVMFKVEKLGLLTRRRTTNPQGGGCRKRE